ncbi:MAG: hypothetical protein ACLVB0_01475 [Fusicatenibacter saccharivorans]
MIMRWKYQDHKEVTVEGARSTRTVSRLGIEPYFAENRLVSRCAIFITGHRNLKNFIRDEMEVYYETDSFICYRLQQNVNSPYNLAIDYGYNNPMPNRADRKSKETDRAGELEFQQKT